MSKEKPISDEEMYKILESVGFDCRLTNDIWCMPEGDSNCKAVCYKKIPSGSMTHYTCQTKLKQVYEDLTIGNKLKAIME
jgi:hypothetical protein